MLALTGSMIERLRGADTPYIAESSSCVERKLRALHSLKDPSSTLSVYSCFVVALGRRGFFLEFAKIAAPMSWTPSASALSLMCA